jgi:hypothetical protein
MWEVESAPIGCRRGIADGGTAEEKVMPIIAEEFGDWFNGNARTSEFFK